MKTYEIFEGEDLKIADRILHLRLLLLVNSCLYYEMDYNIISDRQWDMWAKELYNLQSNNKEISDKVEEWREAFSDWDGSTGAFLPLKDEWVVQKAKWLMNARQVNKLPVADVSTIRQNLKHGKVGAPKPIEKPKKQIQIDLF